VCCKKDELQSRYEKFNILSKTGSKIAEMENLIDKKRSTLNPEGYNSLADYATAEVKKVLLKELLPDSSHLLSKNGDIPLVIEAYISRHREKHPKKKSRVWNGIRVSVDADVYRACTIYSEELLSHIKDYCEGTITGSPEYVQGVRDASKEQEILVLFMNDPDEEWSYESRLWTYFRDFAHDPNKKAKKKKEGFLNLGWFD
jgi:hypothetical protein